MLNQNNNTTSPAGTPIPTVKKELPKKSKLPLYFTLLLIVVVAFAGIGISLRQYLVRDTVAPTAPTESQASVDKIQDCSLSFDVAPPESGINCIKQAYRDELSNTPGDYELTTTQSTFSPGDIVVYSFIISNTGEQTATISATDTITTNVADNVFFDYDFLDSSCGDNAYQNDTLTCTANDLPAGENQTFTFRIRLSDQITTALSINNTVQITDGEIDNSCSIDIDLTPPTVAYCGDSCQSNNDCVESDQTCYNNECRLSTNPTSPDCRPPTEKPTPTPEINAYCGEYCATNSDCVGGDQICYFNQCRLTEYPDRQDCSIPNTPTPTPFVEPSPAIGCNETCITNRDCSNNDQICYEGSCRLADYPASTSCTIPVTTQPQPKMPQELPKSGSDDLINWIKAGIGILGAGALLLLL